MNINTFYDIPTDIIEFTLLPLLGYSIYDFSFVSKTIFNLKKIQDELKRVLTNAKKIKNYFDKSAIDLFGNIYNLAYYPELNWNTYFEGCTGYIDRIKKKDVSNKIMWGVSSCKRAYITLRTNVGVITLFQRYAHGSNGIWVPGDGDQTRLFTSSRLLDDGKMKDPFLAINIFNLLIGKKKYIYQHYLNNELLTRKIYLL
jgi:hypothetical protein